MIVSNFSIPSIQVGNRVFTDLKNVIVLRTSCAASGNLYGTLRLPNASAGYQVPAGKTLRIWAVRSIHSTINQGVNVGYGDDDKGLNSASAPTNAVWNGGANSQIMGKNSGQYGSYDYPCNFTVPTGKYPAAYCDASGGAQIEVWGYLE